MRFWESSEKARAIPDGFSWHYYGPSDGDLEGDYINEGGTGNFNYQLNVVREALNAYQNGTAPELNGKKYDLRRVQQYLLERWGGDYEAIFSNKYLLELTDKGSNKGAMVAKVARMLSIPPERVYCIGDNQNDIPMLALSAIPFAPANCAPEVKQWGARILGACEESCVAQIVDILDHIYA